MGSIKLFESKQIRSVWNESEEKWYFVIEDVIAVLTDSTDPKQYIKRMRQRDLELAKGWVQIVPTLYVETNGGRQKMGCANAQNLLRIIQSIPSPKAEPFGLTPKEYKEVKGLKSQNLRDHMTDLELIFSMLGEASTKEIAVNTDTIGFIENQNAARAGGKIAGDARKQLELKSGKSVITSDNYLPESKKKKFSNIKKNEISE